MLQLIQRQSVAEPHLKPGRLADPDVLLQINGEFSRLGSSTPKVALSRLFSSVLHDIRMAGAWKRTNEGRLAKTEAMLIKHMAPRYRGSVSVLDVGASDGITTFELFRALHGTFGGDVITYLADLNIWLYRYRLGPIVEYRASNGEAIMVRASRVGLRLAEQRYKSARHQGLLPKIYLNFRPLRRAMKQDARIPLVSPIATSEPGIKIIELNCLVRNSDLIGQFSAIRASNVLNLGYFTPKQIAEAVGHLYAYLPEEGCLVISRNVDYGNQEIENGSVWTKRSGGLVWVEDFGSGSEVRKIVDG